MGVLLNKMDGVLPSKVSGLLLHQLVAIAYHLEDQSWQVRTAVRPIRSLKNTKSAIRGHENNLSTGTPKLYRAPVRAPFEEPL